MYLPPTCAAELPAGLAGRPPWASASALAATANTAAATHLRVIDSSSRMPDRAEVDVVAESRPAGRFGPDPCRPVRRRRRHPRRKPQHHPFGLCAEPVRARVHYRRTL